MLRDHPPSLCRDLNFRETGFLKDNGRSEWIYVSQARSGHLETHSLEITKATNEGQFQADNVSNTGIH